MISVVLPVRNEQAFIARTLDALLQQDYPLDRFEILVMDGESTDGTPRAVEVYVERFTNVHLRYNPRRWSSAARNLGIQDSKGEIILIVDGHCELRDRQHLRRLAAAFEQSGADCIGRPQPLDISGANKLQRAIAAARSSRLGHHPDSFIYSSQAQFVPAHSVAVAYRRSVFTQVGCFDERFDACEDVELNTRIDQAGLKCFFTPEVAVHYAPRGTLTGLYRQLVRYGRGRVRLVRKHPHTFSLGSFLPALFVLGCLGGLCVLWLSKWLAVTYFGTLALYASIILATSTMIALRQRKLFLLPWLLVVFPVVHVASGMGVLWEVVAGKSLRLAAMPDSSRLETGGELGTGAAPVVAAAEAESL